MTCSLSHNHLALLPSDSMPGSHVNDVPWPRGLWVTLWVSLPTLPMTN